MVKYISIESVLKVFLGYLVLEIKIFANLTPRFPGLPCRVFHTGEIEWNPGVIIYSSCDLDVTYFPMDTQVIIIWARSPAKTANKDSLDFSFMEVPRLSFNNSSAGKAAPWCTGQLKSKLGILRRPLYGDNLQCIVQNLIKL